MKKLTIFLLTILLFTFNSAVIMAATSKQKKSYPDWYLSPPTNPNKIYATGVSKKRNRQLSIDAATSAARDEILRTYQVKVSNLLKNYVEESGNKDKIKNTQFSSTISKQIAEGVVSGVKVEKIDSFQHTEPETFFVLVSLDLNDTFSRVISTLNNIKADSDDYSLTEKDLEEMTNRIKGLTSDYFDKGSEKEEIKELIFEEVAGKKKRAKWGKEPEWVQDFPSSDTYYIGIGTAENLETAQNLAISMIISQIKTKLQSEVLTYAEETNLVSNESVSHKIKQTVKKTLEDVEYVDSYKAGKNEFWSYYRLNIAEYKRKEQEKMDNAKSNALDYLKKADAESDVSLALKYVFIGYSFIGNYITKALKVNYNGREIILANELTSKVQSLLNDVKIEKVSPTSISIDKLNPTPVNVLFKVSYKDTPVKNFPFYFTSTADSLELSEPLMSDSQGRVTCTIRKSLGSQKSVELFTKPDILSFLDQTVEDEDEKVYFSNILSLGLPKSDVKVSVNQPQYQFIVESDEPVLQANMPKLKRGASELKNILAKESSAVFTEGESKYALIMNYTGGIKLSDLLGQYFAKMSIVISIKDLENDKELFTKSTPIIKGGSITEKKALDNAIDKYLSVYNQKMAEYIMDFFEGK